MIERLCFFLIAFWGLTSVSCYAQDDLYIDTKPNVYLYEVPNNYPFPLSVRGLFDTSKWKKKRMKKSTTLRVIDYSNFNKSFNYDAYVVENDGKYYYISSADVIDASLIESRNKELAQKYQLLQDSVRFNIASANAYNQLISYLNERIGYYEKQYKNVDTKRDSIILANRRIKIEKDIQLHRDLRAQYDEWVASLPKAIQKDAKTLAILETDFSVGYVGECSYGFAFINLSPKKTIKYLYWYGKVKNAVGDYISCTIRHTSSFTGTYTGPCPPYGNDYPSWTVLYNSTADRMVLNSIKIVYTDGTTTTIGKQSLDAMLSMPNTIFAESPTMFSVYEESDKYIDAEVSPTEIYEYDAYKRKFAISDSLSCYRDTKRIIENKEEKRWISTKLSTPKFSIVNQDKKATRLIGDYILALYADDEVVRRLNQFKMNNFLD